MKPRSLPWLIASALTALAMVVAIGCTTPDRWTALEPDFERRIPGDDDPPIEIPKDFEPTKADEPVFQLPAEGSVELSAEQAVMLALRNNRDLSVRQFTPVIAGTFEQIERGSYDPELFADLEYAEEKASETARATGGQFNVEGRDTSAGVGIRQFLPTGTTVAGEIRQERSISNRSPEQQVARLELSVTQSLLQGFGPAVNLASVRQAELNTLASAYELRRFTETLLADTETAYWSFVLAEEEITIFEQSLDIAKQQRDEIAERIEVGVLAEMEIPAARAEVARREQALIAARSLKEERRVRLLRLVDPDPSGRLDRRIRAVSKPEIAPQPITDLNERLDLAEKLRPDLNEARLQLQRNRLETIVTRNGLLPRLDFFIAVGKTGFADTFSDSFRELSGGTYDFSAGVGLRHFLGNRAAKGRDTAARATREQSAAAVENLRQLVRFEVRLAANEVERAREQISASKVTRVFQEQTLKAEMERFDVGLSTGLLVAQAQRDLLLSRIEEVRSVVNYRVALANLYLAEGSLLERRGIQLSPAGPRDALAGTP